MCFCGTIFRCIFLSSWSNRYNSSLTSTLSNTFLNFHVVWIGLRISVLHPCPSIMAAQTWPPSHRNLKPFHMPQVQHRTIGVQYPGRSGICKLFETLNSLKPGSRSGYKHVQVHRRGFIPEHLLPYYFAPWAPLITPILVFLLTLAACSCTAADPWQCQEPILPGLSDSTGYLRTYCQVLAPGFICVEILQSSANPISHIHKGPQWQAAQASPDFHTNAHHSSTKMNWASLCKYKGRWPCLPREAAGNPVVPKLQLHRSPCWSHSTCGLSSKTHGLCFRHPEPRSWVEKENK